MELALKFAFLDEIFNTKNNILVELNQPAAS